MKMENTYEVKIYVGLRIGYSDVYHSLEEAKQICQKYVDEIGWCVTVTETEFIYKGGNEKGIIVGIIQYPRFPLPTETINTRVFELAQALLDGLEQQRLSVVFSDVTMMIGEDGVKDA